MSKRGGVSGLSAIEFNANGISNQANMQLKLFAVLLMLIRNQPLIRCNELSLVIDWSHRIVCSPESFISVRWYVT